VKNEPNGKSLREVKVRVLQASLTVRNDGSFMSEIILWSVETAIGVIVRKQNLGGEHLFNLYVRTAVGRLRPKEAGRVTIATKP